ncbi:serine/threonine protein phosphatase [Sulfurimonas sediminis]|uniref:Serine/threonine protein phosphatase n=1 Tax=Sulfurimonas sediminis TaxID=2590020 RepID=A0A7M1B751_9BACT|nr:metallophosphoesterase [Sulfurimonas sediminis]QOP44532.1 serine/threonine protein phosphatase [Sulfurimonas sediminis]
MKRRDFIKKASVVAAGTILPMSIIEVAFADNIDGSKSGKNFTFAVISDAHLQQIKGAKFVRNWDMGLKKAIAECNLMNPKPDFVLFGGDLGQLGKAAEIDHGAEILSALRAPVKMMLGEHDYYLDLGEHWMNRFGDPYYSFDHKGVHIVVLNSILVDEKWTHKWKNPMDRMQTMAGLDDPNGSAFMVGEKQRQWLKEDLSTISNETPIIVFSHSPLQKIYKGWNFWTDDAEQIQAILKPFKKVNVIYGHVHQIQYNKIGNIAFNSVMSTAWPWPYPKTYTQGTSYMPKLTIEMNRADPFFERDATGWEMIDVHSGRVDLHFQLPNNENRTVAYNEKTQEPEDIKYQHQKIPSQRHY